MLACTERVIKRDSLFVIVVCLWWIYHRMAILNLVGNFLSNILLLRALSHVANADLIETLLVIMSY